MTPQHAGSLMILEHAGSLMTPQHAGSLMTSKHTASLMILEHQKEGVSHYYLLVLSIELRALVPIKLL